MSVNMDTYMCIGYDLTTIKDDIMTKEFKETKEYDDLISFQVKDHVALFPDPMSGDHLYLGYVLGEILEDYADEKIEFDFNNIGNIERIINPIMERMMELAGNPDVYFPLKLMTFTEFSWFQIQILSVY